MDEGSNLNAMTTALKSIMKCEVVSLDKTFQGICFVYVFSKTCQHATTNEKACKNLNVFPSSVICHIYKMYNLA
jgi:hypothetical protein